MDERFCDVDERFIPPSTSGGSESVTSGGAVPPEIDIEAVKNLLESTSNSSLANITNHPATSSILNVLLQRPQASPPLSTTLKPRSSHELVTF